MSDIEFGLLRRLGLARDRRLSPIRGRHTMQDVLNEVHQVNLLRRFDVGGLQAPFQPSQDHVCGHEGYWIGQSSGYHVCARCGVTK